MNSGPAAEGNTCIGGKRRVAVAVASEYAEMLGSLKAQVRQAQFRAQHVVNEQLIGLYRSIGREINGGHVWHASLRLRAGEG